MRQFITKYLVSGPKITPFAHEQTDTNQIRYEQYLRSIIAEKHTLPPQGQFLQADGCQVSAVKTAEDGSDLILRLYNPTKDHQTALLRFSVPVVSALRQTTMETPLPIPCRWAEQTVLTRLEAFETATVRVVLSSGEGPEAG